MFCISMCNKYLRRTHRAALVASTDLLKVRQFKIAITMFHLQVLIVIFAAFHPVFSMVAVIGLLVCAASAHKHSPHIFVFWNLSHCIVSLIIMVACNKLFLLPLEIQIKILKYKLIYMILVVLTKMSGKKYNKAILLTGERIGDLVFCGRCNAHVMKASRHVVWIDTCVSKHNEIFHIFTLMVALYAFWISAYNTLLSLCDSRGLFGFPIPIYCAMMYYWIEFAVGVVNSYYELLFCLFVLIKIITIVAYYTLHASKCATAFEKICCLF